MHPKIQELRQRGHSYRNFTPSEIRELLEDDDIPNDQIRDFFEFMESGRFRPMLKSTHKMFAALDPDEAEAFWRRNPDLMAWVNTWAKSEDLIDWAEQPGLIDIPENAVIRS